MLFISGHVLRQFDDDRGMRKLLGRNFFKINILENTRKPIRSDGI